jgi:LmbE family N-acetylglucosaminyl deacetylase
MPKTILMLATFGSEFAEVGGTLALHAQAGDAVHGALLLSRPEARPQVTESANILGLRSMHFLDFAYGEVQVDVPSKIKLVRVFREVRPDIVITQDPDHVVHDLDPDRRMAMLLYLESLAVSGRDWRIDECGGFQPHHVNTLYYMWAENPNCVVEIGPTFAVKLKALQALRYQLAFTAQALRERMGVEALRHVVPNFDELKHDNLVLGKALQTEMERANAMYHGVISHSGAGLAEAFRHEGPIKLDQLI